MDADPKSPIQEGRSSAFHAASCSPWVGRVILSDCMDVLSEMPSKSVDAVITDPPYGTTALEWDDASNVINVLRECLRISRGAVCVFGSNPFSADVVSALRKHWRHGWVWEKDKPANIYHAKIAPMKMHEDVLVFSETGMTYNPQMQERPEANRRNNAPRTNTSNLYGNALYLEKSNGDNPEKYPTSIQRFNTERAAEHPTQKPLKLLRYLVETYTNPGDVVMDCYAGSGTTILASKQTGRQWIGIEKTHEYVEITKSRLAQELSLF
jgi:site-specific DNA-methyltransferase (adenine-specific)